MRPCGSLGTIQAPSRIVAIQTATNVGQFVSARCTERPGPTSWLTSSVAVRATTSSNSAYVHSVTVPSGPSKTRKVESARVATASAQQWANVTASGQPAMAQSDPSVGVP